MKSTVSPCACVEDSTGDLRHFTMPFCCATNYTGATYKRYVRHVKTSMCNLLDSFSLSQLSFVQYFLRDV